MTATFFTAARNLLAEWERFPQATRIPVYAVALKNGTSVHSEAQARNLGGFTNLNRIAGTEQLVRGRILCPTPATNTNELHCSHVILDGIVTTAGAKVDTVLLYYELGPSDSQRIPFYGDSTGLGFTNAGGRITWRPDRLGVVHYSISGAPNPKALPGSVYSAEHGYSETPAFSIDPNPTWNGLLGQNAGQSDAYAKYQLTNVATGAILKRDTNSIPFNDGTILSNAGRRMWTASAGVQANRIVDIAPGVVITETCNIGGTNTGNGSTMFWGPAGATQFNQFIPITGLTIRSRDPANPARIYGFGRNSRMTIGNNQGVVGPCGVKFEYLEIFHRPGSTYILEDFLAGPTGFTHIYEQLCVWWCKLIGDSTWGGIWDAHSLMRGGHSRWNIQSTEFWRGEQHLGYINQPQGMALVSRCFNSSPTGLAGSRAGWTAFQFVQRSRTDDPPGSLDPYYGGPPGYGTILMQDCVWTHTGHAAGGNTGAFTVAGFLGNAVMEDCEVNDADGGGAATFWCPGAGGLWTNIGSFDLPPFPAPGTAYTIKYALVDNVKFNQNVGYTNATNPFAFSSCGLAQIGAFDGQSAQAMFGFWTWNGDWQTGFPFGGPLDNLRVEFLVPQPINTYAGFNGNALKAKYGANNNPNQPGGASGNGVIQTAQLNALIPGNAAYPPWQQGQTLPAVVLFDFDSESTLTATNLSTVSFLFNSQSSLTASALAQVGLQFDSESTFVGLILDGAFVASFLFDSESTGPTITFSQPASVLFDFDSESTCGQFEPVVEPPPDVNGPPPPAAAQIQAGFAPVRKGGLKQWRVGAV